MFFKYIIIYYLRLSNYFLNIDFDCQIDLTAKNELKFLAKLYYVNLI